MNQKRELEQEFEDWERLSDEALVNFERKITPSKTSALKGSLTVFEPKC